jgi:hypothetical protein
MQFYWFNKLDSTVVDPFPKDSFAHTSSVAPWPVGEVGFLAAGIPGDSDPGPERHS